MITGRFAGFSSTVSLCTVSSSRYFKKVVLYSTSSLFTTMHCVYPHAFLSLCEKQSKTGIYLLTNSTIHCSATKLPLHKSYIMPSTQCRLPFNHRSDWSALSYHEFPPGQ